MAKKRAAKEAKKAPSTGAHVVTDQGKLKPTKQINSLEDDEAVKDLTSALAAECNVAVDAGRDLIQQAQRKQLEVVAATAGTDVNGDGAQREPELDVAPAQDVPRTSGKKLTGLAGVSVNLLREQHSAGDGAPVQDGTRSTGKRLTGLDGVSVNLLREQHSAELATADQALIPARTAEGNSEVETDQDLCDQAIMIASQASASMVLSCDLQNQRTEALRPEASFRGVYEFTEAEPVARGAFAQVWRCQLRERRRDEATSSTSPNKATSSTFVAKCIERSRLQKVDQKNLFGADGRDGELRLHSKIIHPNVVRLISIFEETDVVSVVLENCNGGDLFDHIRAHKRATGGGVSEIAAAACMRQLLGALTFLHTGSIVHRDVKCENLLLAEKGLPLERTTVKLGDFGFAVCLHQVPGGKLYSIMGSPSTVAPEVLDNKKPYGMPADLWSGGVVLYNLIAATQPFKAPTPKEIMKLVRAGAYSLEGPNWAEVDDPAKNLVRCLMCSAETRLRAPQALLHTFLRVDREVVARERFETCAEPESEGESPEAVDRFGSAEMTSPDNEMLSCQSPQSNACDSDFGVSARQFMELNRGFETARSSRLPSIAGESDMTEETVPDSEYGLSEWQMSYARRMTPKVHTRSTGLESENSEGGSPQRGSFLLPPYATRSSRMTSTASDTTLGDSAYLGDSQNMYGFTEEQMANISPKADLVLAVLFKPGTLGIGFCCNSGRVMRIHKDGQGERNNVRVGMLTRSVAGKPYSEEILDQCINNEEDYEVVFATFSPLKSEKVPRTEIDNLDDSFLAKHSRRFPDKGSPDNLDDSLLAKHNELEAAKRNDTPPPHNELEAAMHNDLAAQKELAELQGNQAALDVLGSRLQEAHQSPPNSVDGSPRRAEVEQDTLQYAVDPAEEEEEDGEELSPFIYKKRNSTLREIYNPMDEDGHSKSRAACCGGGWEKEEDRPWWSRLFL